MSCATGFILKASPFFSASSKSHRFFLLTTCNNAARRYLSHTTGEEEPSFPLPASCSVEGFRPPGVRPFDPPNPKTNPLCRKTVHISCYATTIEGLCHARKTNAAIKALEKMVKKRVVDYHTSVSCCNTILGTLSVEERLKEALGFVERYPLYGISPDVCTYNILVQGFCRRGEVAGANKVLKLMTCRGLTPTSTTYNHFLGMFSRLRDVGACTNLYEMLLKSGFAPDLATYRIVIDVLCRNLEFGVAVKVIRDMKRSGLELGPKRSTMLVQMLCNSCRWDEACVEFEVMIREGKMPPYALYKRLLRDLKRLGMEEMVGKISRLMQEVFRSKNYWEREGERSHEMKRTIFEKAKVISEALKVSGERRRADKLRARRRFFRQPTMRRV